MSTTVESLELEVKSSSGEAAKGIDALSSSLKKLKKAVNGGLGLEAIDTAKLSGLSNSLQKLSGLGNLKISASVANQIRNIGNAVQSLQGTDFSKLSSLGSALAPLASIGKSNLSSFISQLKRLPEAVVALNSVDMNLTGSNIEKLASALVPLSEMGKNNLTSYITQLKKLPEVVTALNGMDIPGLKNKIEQLASAFRPLGTEMQNISNGFSALPARLQRVIKQTENLSASNNKAGKSYTGLAAKLGVNYVMLRRIARILGSAINQSNKYVEDLNLFTASMRQYAEEAQAFAEKVSALMGIDPAEWMRNQGIFNTVLTGFGVVNDRADIMSQNLTQLGYDISSFFNVSTEDAFSKLQSGIAGELEPLRRLGYDLSVARLQQEALNLGIEKSVSAMTQAEKAELRYYAIMTQVTTAQGDMSRTLEAPANQLRILKAQVTQCARALGNIFIPALTTVLPYAIAFVQVLREIANVFANLLGFTLPEIDYSGLESASGSATDLSDGLEDANEEAKKLKRALMGFDELNVLPSVDSGAGTGTDTSVGGGLGIELPTYDFIGNAVSTRVKEIVDGMKEWLGITGEINSWSELYETRLGKILDTVIKIATGFVAWKALKKIVTLVEALKTLFVKIKALKVVDSFLNGFKLIRATGGNLFESIRGGLDSVRASLTGIQKAAIVAIAGFAEFMVVKDNVKELVKGTDNVIGNIVQIGVVSGIAAVAMYTALGPAGLAIAAVVGLTAAIAGVIEVQNEMMTAMNNEVFYSGTGVKISDLSAQYGKLMESIVATNQPIIDNQAKINDLRSSVEQTSTSIGGISNALINGAATASEKIEEIKALFTTLQTDTKSIMDAIYDNIIASIGGSFGQALIQAGESIPQVLEILKQIKGEGENTLSSLQTEMEQITTDLENGKISQEEFATRWVAIEEKINSLIGASKEYSDVFANLKEQMGSINWENDEAKNNFFASITQSSDEARGSIEATYAAISENLESMKNWTTDDSLKSKIDTWIKISEEDKQAQLSSVNQQLTSLYDSIQEDMLTKTVQVKDRAVEEWNNMDWLTQFFNGGSESEYVFRCLKNYRDNIVSPISADIESSYQQIGVDGSAWASNAMNNIITSFFKYGINGSGLYVDGYASSLESAVQDALNGVSSVGQSAAKAAGAGIASAFMKSLQPITNNGVHFNVSASLNGNTPKINGYASGGYPNAGSLFIANEAGPEMVGTIGGRTAVANNTQIEEALYNAVLRALADGSNNNSSGEQVIRLEVDGDVLAETVNRQNNIRSRRFNGR